MRFICRGCDAVQKHRMIICEKCCQPLVFPESFTCPDCGSVSFNIHDISERYCGCCGVFLDDLRPVELEQPEGSKRVS